MELIVRSIQDGSKVKALKVSEKVFQAELNQGLVHQVMVSYQAAGRQGTKANKSRSDVRGGGRKPWKQKGTGRARAGTSRGPIWRGGGVTFAARPRDFSKKVNRKMYRKALCCVLSSLVEEGRLIVVADFEIEAIKTKALQQKINQFEGKSYYLVAKDKMPTHCELSARNIPCVFTGGVPQLNFIALLHYDRIIMTHDAVVQLEKVLS